MPLAAMASARYSFAMSNPFPVLLIVALVATVGVLFLGLFSMARGGEFNKKYGNRLMRWRVFTQGAALVLLALAMLSSSD
jgi:hypothetical protein